MSAQTILNPKPFTSPVSTLHSSSHSSSSLRLLSFPNKPKNPPHSLFHIHSISAKSDQTPNPKPNPNPNPNPKIKPNSKRKPSSQTPTSPNQAENIDKTLPKTIPRKPRRGRRSEAAAVEDFVREKLEETFESIRQQNPQILDDKEKVLKDNNDVDDDGVRKKKAVVEQEDPNWPLDADIGWGIRASEYFDKHSIKNVLDEDGVEIDWEGEVEDNYVKEINCLEWESLAFHPSPLIVLVFERYNRASENWKYLKELEKAIKVYWNAKDRLPPRTVKIDINIERDMAYALKVRDCPQLLFLRGNKILYREKDVRTADELIQMIAHFYYNAKKPSWIDDAAVSPP